jgi:hypothetical protein
MHSHSFTRPPRDRRAARLVALHDARRPGAMPSAAPDEPVAAQLRRTARFLRAEARLGDPRVEPLISALGRRWLSLPGAAVLADPARRAAAWRRFVACCETPDPASLV